MKKRMLFKKYLIERREEKINLKSRIYRKNSKVKKLVRIKMQIRIRMISKI